MRLDAKPSLNPKRSHLELSPAEYFQQVALNDLAQNKRLSMGLIGSNGTYKLNKASQGHGGEKTTKLRFIVCTLGLAALAMSQMSRAVLYLTITQMIEQPDSHQNQPEPLQNQANERDMLDGSCPWPSFDSNNVAPADGTACVLGTESTELCDPLISEGPSALLTEDEQVESSEEQSLPEKPLIGEGQLTAESYLEDQAELSAANLPQQVDVRVPPPPTYPRYKWSMKQQSVLLGGFFYSYFVFMVISGRIAEIYGAKYVLLLSVAGSAVINMATPWMADTSFALLVVSRVVMGAIQAGVMPGMYALFSKWLTMTEASIFAPLIKMNLRLGMLLGSSVPGIVTGWPNVFYLTGLLSIVWSLLWLVLATSDPADNSWVSDSELQHINRKKGKQRQAQHDKSPIQSIELKEKNGVASAGDDHRKQTSCVGGTPPAKPSTPWIKILTHQSVIALIIVKLTVNYGVDFLAIELPSYLKYVHHASKEQISSISSGMFLIQVLLIVFVGWLAKIAIQRRPFGLSKTGVRKLFQGTTNFGMSCAFFLLTFNDCNLTYVTVLLWTASMLSMFTSGGETMLPYDLSEEYPATIMAVANSFANLSAVTITTLTAFVLGDQAASFERWNKLIYTIAAVNLTGGLVFSFLAKAEPIDFTSGPGNKKNNKDNNNNNTGNHDLEGGGETRD